VLHELLCGDGLRDEECKLFGIKYVEDNDNEGPWHGKVSNI
jgi:hypothetical protein